MTNATDHQTATETAAGARPKPTRLLSWVGLATAGWTYNPATDTIDVGGRDFARTAKFRNVERNPNVALVVDEILPPFRPRAVLIRGRGEALGDTTGADGTPTGPIIRITPTQIVNWGLDDPCAPHRGRCRPRRRSRRARCTGRLGPARHPRADHPTPSPSVDHDRRRCPSWSLWDHHCPATASPAQTGQCSPACTSSSPRP